MKTLLTLLMAIITFSAFAAPNRSDIRTTLQNAIPQNWVIVESQAGLLISNKTEVTFFNAIAMDGSETDLKKRIALGEKGHFVIKLTIGPFLPQNVYHEIEQTLLHRTDRGKPSIPSQDFYANREDALPDGFGPDYSIYISTNRHPSCLVWSEKVDPEWQQVLLSIFKIFENYNDLAVIKKDDASKKHKRDDN